MPYILHLLYASEFDFPMAAALSCLPYITLPSLNGLPSPDDDDDAAGDDNDEQGKTYYLIHTGNWQRNCRKEGKKKAKKVKIKKPAFVCHSIFVFWYTHTFFLFLFLFLSLPLNPVKVQYMMN